MNTKESNKWFVEYCKVPGKIYNRIYRKVEGALVFEMEIYTSEPVSLDEQTLNALIINSN